MTSWQLTLTDLVADASPGWLESGINSELSMLLWTSIGRTFHASLYLRFVDLKSIWLLVHSCRDASLVDWRLKSARNVSSTVDHNSIVISSHFASAISAPQSVWYLASRLRVVMCRKGVIHEIQYAKRIWNCKSDNSVKAYARVRPRRKDYL